MTKKINDQSKKQKSSPLRGLAFVLNFKILNFEFVSNFVLRISYFWFRLVRAMASKRKNRWALAAERLDREGFLDEEGDKVKNFIRDFREGFTL